MDKLTFRALAIRQSELGSKPGDCGYVVYTPEVGNVVGGNVVKREAFVDSVAIESVDLKDKFCSRVLRPFVMPW